MSVAYVEVQGNQGILDDDDALVSLRLRCCCAKGVRVTRVRCQVEVRPSKFKTIGELDFTADMGAMSVADCLPRGPDCKMRLCVEFKGSCQQRLHLPAQLPRDLVDSIIAPLAADLHAESRIRDADHHRLRKHDVV